MNREKLAYQKGAKDAYYGRSWNPKLPLDDEGTSVLEIEDMTKLEIAEYSKGYHAEPYGQKDYGDDNPTE